MCVPVQVNIQTKYDGNMWIGNYHTTIYTKQR